MLRNRIISYKSERGQEIVIVLQALDELGGIRTKEETLDYIFWNKWIEVFSGEMEPYEDSREPRIRTLLAWAKKDAMTRGYINHNGRDEWEITRAGREAIEEYRRRAREKIWDVRKCYRWSPVFKKLMDPEYYPLASDKTAPSEVSNIIPI